MTSLLRSPNPILVAEKTAHKEVIYDSVRCSKCRTLDLLIPSSVPCVPGVCDFHRDVYPDIPTQLYVHVDNCPEVFLEQISQASWTKGKLRCEKCGGVIGSFNFISSVQCSHCDYHLPNVNLHIKKVDLLSSMSCSKATRPLNSGVFDTVTQVCLNEDGLQEIQTLESNGITDNYSVTQCRVPCHIPDSEQTRRNEHINFGLITATHPSGDGTGSLTESTPYISTAHTGRLPKKECEHDWEREDQIQNGMHCANSGFACSECVKKPILYSSALKLGRHKRKRIGLRQEIEEGTVERNKDLEDEAENNMLHANDRFACFGYVQKPSLSSSAPKLDRHRRHRIERRQQIEEGSVDRNTDLSLLPKRNRRSKPPTKLKSTACVVTGEEVKEPRKVITVAEELDDEEHMCAVCFEIMLMPHALVPCQHMFCIACLWALARHSQNQNTLCPLCRTLIEKCDFQQEKDMVLQVLYPVLYRQRKQFIHRGKRRGALLPSSSHGTLGLLRTHRQRWRGETNALFVLLRNPLFLVFCVYLICQFVLWSFRTH